MCGTSVSNTRGSRRAFQRDPPVALVVVIGSVGAPVDDGSGWNDILLELWSDAVRDAVVARIERETVGRRGWLVRVFCDPEAVRGEFTETAHALVLAAIRDETGADLDDLGSQAAWECYEQVWEALDERLRTGEVFVAVPIGTEPDIAATIRRLPVEAAAHAGADVTRQPPDPLWVAGRLLVDADGLHRYLSLDGGRTPSAVRRDVTAILGALPGP